MALHGQSNNGFLHVSTGEDDIMEELTRQFPDAIEAAHRQIAKMSSGSGTLIARFTAEQLSEDRSDEIAIVGKLKK